MKLFNLTIARRLGLGFGVVLVLPATVAGLGIVNPMRLNDDTVMLVDHHWPKAKREGEALEKAGSGATQVDQASGDMDAVTQQNAALVEQARPPSAAPSVPAALAGHHARTWEHA